MAETLVFALRHIPLPATSGAPIRSLRLLTGLAREFDCVMVCPGFGAGQDVVAPEEIEAALPGVEVVAVPHRLRSRRARQVRSLAGAASAEFGGNATSALRTAVREEASRRGAEVVHYDDVSAGLCGPVPGVLNAFAPHNVEHRILADTARHSRGPRGAFALYDGIRLRREELRLWRSMDLCVAVSDLDAAAMRAGGARALVIAPNGTDGVPRQPTPTLPAGRPLRMLFVGAGDYQPNRAGLRWLIDEILPRLDDRDWTLDVVGTPPGVLPAHPRVTFHGRVASVAPYYAAAHLAVVPIPYGSGTRLKVVEAMARGIPVVATPVGAEGLGLRAGEHFLCGADTAAFADALVQAAARLEGAGPSLEPLLAAARAVAERLFWPRIAAALAADYRAASG